MHCTLSLTALTAACRYYFNRGALFNAGALLLEGTAYDHYAFHDVDTVCGEQPIPYSYPAGEVPLHLTPPGLHPRDDYPEFLGGNIVFTREQFRTVNGFHVRNEPSMIVKDCRVT